MASSGFSVSVLSAVWRYVRIQLLVFACGIVGPIFLFVYFAIQPDPTIKWMYWWGLFITVADVLVALAISNRMEPKKTSSKDSD